ncbi:MAG TPA: hypothetical protein PLL98_09135 [Bacillota bacterium]|nr:hypothetical protein [Bacillota bacterium]HPL53348.1 hypothetical protein [Bacillota bacterium]HPL53365.1 hypothetical protein [Bacillota bacterium]
MKIEMQRTKGTINIHPNNLRNEVVLLTLALYDMIKKEEHIITMNNILSYSSA